LLNDSSRIPDDVLKIGADKDDRPRREILRRTERPSGLLFRIVTERLGWTTYSAAFDTLHSRKRLAVLIDVLLNAGFSVNGLCQIKLRSPWAVFDQVLNDFAFYHVNLL
jgi:hypothetical protein